MRILKQVLASGLGLLLAACASMPDADPGPAAVGGAISTFESPEQIDAYLAAQRDELAYIRKRKQEEGYQERIVVTGSQIADVAITNTQEEGVDEGGIVKANSEYLVILRRGRIHVVRHGDDTLEPVSSIDAFPPDDPDPDDTWYDEMLLHQGTVIIIGYSYGEDGTEISRFDLSDDGELSYRDTHYLNSWDYYSSSNYASRLVGGTLYTYTPSSFDAGWREELPFLERRNPDGSRVRIATTLEPQRMGIAAPQLIDVAPNARMMHGITQCDILSEQLTCSTRTVLGTRSSEYYFSAEAAYIWTGSGHDNAWGRASKDWQELVFRIPFDYSKDMTAMSVQGDPVDQFSFLEDGETGSLFVMTVGDFVFDDYDGFGMMMWESEYAFGEAALARIPLSDMGNGSDMLPPSHYRALPEVSGRVQNRYVGRHLMVGGGYWRDDESPSEFYVTPLDEGWVQRIDLPHEVSRLDRLGNDGMVVGRGDEDALGFSAIEFSEDRPGGKLASTYMLASAEEGENRSQAFYWRPDPDEPNSGDGLMALPVGKDLEGHDFYYLGSATRMFYLQRKDRKLSPVGELGTYPDESVIAAAEEMEELENEGNCKASCTDWYGNSRPIFIGDRILALMGDEIIEGAIEDGPMREIRRINFAR